MNSAVLVSCIISPPTELVAGRFRLDRVSFSAYWHDRIISQIKPLPSMSCWPDDLSCHVFIHAKWLFLWYVSFGVTDKSPALGKKENVFLLVHFITKHSRSSDSCENPPEIIDVTPINLALLFNTNDQENGSLSKHRVAWMCYIKA